MIWGILSTKTVASLDPDNLVEIYTVSVPSALSQSGIASYADRNLTCTDERHQMEHFPTCPHLKLIRRRSRSCLATRFWRHSQHFYLPRSIMPQTAGTCNLLLLARPSRPLINPQTQINTFEQMDLLQPEALEQIVPLLIKDDDIAKRRLGDARPIRKPCPVLCSKQQPAHRCRRSWPARCWD